MQYRKEIDGLRALAVLPVILFHAGIFGFSGGYIGVDIFFVISGYLITGIIIDELAADTFSIKKFYERRAKRILPALSAVLIVTTVLAFIFMPANLLKSYANSLISVMTFTSNFHFFSTSGYFSTVSDQKPLLHTWSLAVEEQFYLFFPILLGYLWVKGKRYAAKVIVTLAIISLLLAQFLAINNYTEANFYLIFSRAWELFAGALIVLTSMQTLKIKHCHKEALGLFGCLLILYAIIVFDKHTLFPSVYTLVPIIGTVLIIAFSTQKTLVGRFLANKLLVSIGLISYSLYLWHQPFFAFLRMKSIGEPETVLFVAAMVLSFICACLSYQYVEKPFRKKSQLVSTTKFSILQYAGMSIAFFIVIGAISVSQRGFQSRFGDSAYIDSIKSSPKRKACHSKGADYTPASESCRYFGKNVTWASLGDSHTVETAYALAKALEAKDIGLMQFSFSNCPPALEFTVKTPGCSKWITESLNYLEKNDAIKNVYLGFYYSLFLFGKVKNHYPEVPNEDPRYQLDDEYQTLSAQQTRELYWQNFELLIKRLIDSGKTVYLQYPVPALPSHINNLLTPMSVFSSELSFDVNKIISQSYYQTRNNYILNKLDSLPYSEKLHAIKPYKLLCQDGHCPVVKNGKSLYFDDNHLSVYAATELIKKSKIVN